MAERAPPSDAPPTGGLVPTLGLLDVTLIGMGTIIGAGIFRVPSDIAKVVPSEAGILLLWAIGGLIALAGAVTFAELGGMFPRTGGQYVFIREGCGRFAAFAFGWILLAAIVSGATAWVAGVFVDHLEKLIHVYAGVEPWPLAMRRTVAVALIALMTAVNIRGVKLGAIVQDLSMGAKIAGILAIVALAAYAAMHGASTGHVESLSPATGPFFGATWRATGAALLPILFAVGGFQNISAVASEIKDPQRNLPRGTLIGIVIVIALYMSVNWAVLAILGVGGTAASPTPAADAAGRVVSWGEPLVAALVTLSTFAFVQAILLVTPRIFFAMARDGVFFSVVGRVHPSWKTPWVAILCQGVLSCVHLFFGEALSLLHMVEVCDVFFFVICAWSLFKLRRTRPDLARPYRAFGYPWFPGLFLVSTAAVFVTSLFSAERAAWMRTAIVLALGAAFYAFWRLRSPRAASA